MTTENTTGANGAPVMVTMAHIRAAGGCAPGLRAWFKKYHLDLRAFIRDGGIEAQSLSDTGDAIALRAVAIARETYQQNRNGDTDGQ